MNHPFKTIIVVDDNAAILTALRICLATEYERIVTLPSPDTLVATLASEEDVDVVLLDMNFSRLKLWSGRAVLVAHHQETSSQHACGLDDGLCQRAAGGERIEIWHCRFRDKAMGQRQADKHLARCHREKSRGDASRQDGAGACATRGGAMSRQYEPRGRDVGHNEADPVQETEEIIVRNINTQ